MTRDILWTNLALEPMPDWYFPNASDIIASNQKVVASNYSLQAKAQQLSDLLSGGFDSVAVEPKPVKIDNQPIFERSLALDSIRLLA